MLQVDAEEAARQAQIAATRRVGTGGLHEQAAEDGGDDSAGETAGEVPAVGQVLSTRETMQCVFLPVAVKLSALYNVGTLSYAAEASEG